MPNRMLFVILKRRPFWKDSIYCKQGANEEQYMKISSGVRDLAVKDATSFKGDEWKYDMSPRCKKVT